MKYLKFADLKARGLVNSHTQLARLQKQANFPLGRLIGPNSRRWTDVEVDRWWDSRPTGEVALRGAAKARLGRPRRAADAVVATDTSAE
jgi:hypothetical protein